jgi:hypothetical protein
MSLTFLSSEDLHALTGRQKPKLQREWLIANGYRFDVRADGRPAVLVSQVETRQAGHSRRSNAEPNFTVLNVGSCRGQKKSS